MIVALKIFQSRKMLHFFRKKTRVASKLLTFHLREKADRVKDSPSRDSPLSAYFAFIGVRR